jgi:hypothetical protein
VEIEILAKQPREIIAGTAVKESVARADERLTAFVEVGGNYNFA